MPLDARLIGFGQFAQQQFSTHNRRRSSEIGWPFLVVDICTLTRYNHGCSLKREAIALWQFDLDRLTRGFRGGRWRSADAFLRTAALPVRAFRTFVRDFGLALGSQP